MRWFSHRTRMVLFIVLAFLALAVIAVGVIRMVNPELNLLRMIGFGDDEKLGAFKTKPYWISLTAEQRTSLAPLEETWDRITPAHKKKWLDIAQRMEKMPPEEKERFRERIQIWANMSPEERKEARQNFLSTRKLDLKDKSTQWDEYQSLPDEKKQEFAAKARTKRQGTSSRPQEEGRIVRPENADETQQPSKAESPDYWR